MHMVEYDKPNPEWWRARGEHEVEDKARSEKEMMMGSIAKMIRNRKEKYKKRTEMKDGGCSLRMDEAIISIR